MLASVNSGESQGFHHDKFVIFSIFDRHDIHYGQQADIFTGYF
tara:strand:+ start:2178 stop:2306 length:129 start_codon:yes stop_codon:yes gene_type:complete